MESTKNPMIPTNNTKLLNRSIFFRWIVKLLRKVFFVLFRAFTNLQVSGLENIPPKGPCLLIFNHLSNFDVPLMFALVNRMDGAGLVASEYRRNPLSRLLVETMGGIWIRRGASDRVALKNALSLLNRGWIIALAPEGGRSPTKSLSKGKVGAAFLASRANVPIIPLAFQNTDKLSSSLKNFRRITVKARFGKPFTLPTRYSPNRKIQLRENTDVMMCRIAVMLPNKYRGVYEDHPYLKELSSQPP